MNTKVRVQLSIMMFIQFFIWGSWYVTMGTYLMNLGFQGIEIGRSYTTMAWAAIAAPIIGMFADRFMASQKVLGIMHIAGAIIMWYVAKVQTPGAFFWVLLVYGLFYMPTLGLVNAISFHQMKNPDKQFPGIRVWGTVGWIAAGLFITMLGNIIGSRQGVDAGFIERSRLPMLIASGMSIILGLYAFTLPDTPPKKSTAKPSIADALGLRALGLMKEFPFAVFTLSSLLICIPLAFYYNFTNAFLNDIGMQNVAGKMTMGQMSEIVFMLLMPLLFARLGVKKMLLAGMLAWVLRYGLFAMGDPAGLVWMLYGGILLHGICFDFFFVTGQIYVDQKAPKEIQANAQGFIAMVTYGLGMLIGGLASGWVVDFYTVDGVKHWPGIWWVPGIMAAVILVLFAVMFREKSRGKSQEAGK